MQHTPFEPGAAFARHLDAGDELAPFRGAFLFAEPDLIHLDGNSLFRPQCQIAEPTRSVLDVEQERYAHYPATRQAVT
jgi:hypothetical protein